MSEIAATSREPANLARLKLLRTHLAEGAEQARRGMFVEEYSVDSVIDALDGVQGPRHTAGA